MKTNVPGMDKKQTDKGIPMKINKIAQESTQI